MNGLTLIKNPKELLSILKETYSDWSEDNASRLAAALAYYTAFSVAPLLLITIVVAGFVFGREAAQGQIFGQLQGLLGPDAAGVIQTSVANSQSSGAGTLSAVIGIATLIWSASGLFSQLQDALNTIWEVRPDPNAGILETVKRRSLSMTMVLGIAFLLLVSLAVSAGLAAVGSLLGNVLPGGTVVWQVINFLLSFALITALFAAMFKVLPDATIAWNDVWIGAAVTSLLFSVGKLLIGLYLGHASIGSTFGAAGSLLVFLVWVYYSAQILLFGAEFTQVYARRYGSRIEPAEGAVPLTEEARAEQGIPHEETVQQAADGGAVATPVRAGQPSNGLASPVYLKGERPDGAYASKAARNGAAHDSVIRQPAAGNGKQRQRGSGGTKGAPDAVKKLMWAGLVSGTMALGTIAARRASAGIWRVALHEEPPTKDV